MINSIMLILCVDINHFKNIIATDGEIFTEKCVKINKLAHIPRFCFLDSNSLTVNLHNV